MTKPKFNPVKKKSLHRTETPEGKELDLRHHKIKDEFTPAEAAMSGRKSDGKAEFLRIYPRHLFLKYRDEILGQKKDKAYETILTALQDPVIFRVFFTWLTPPEDIDLRLKCYRIADPLQDRAYLLRAFDEQVNTRVLGRHPHAPFRVVLLNVGTDKIFASMNCEQRFHLLSANTMALRQPLAF